MAAIVVRQSDNYAFISHKDEDIVRYIVDTKNKYRYVFMSPSEIYGFILKLPEWSPLKKSLTRLASEIQWKKSA